MEIHRCVVIQKKIGLRDKRLLHHKHFYCHMAKRFIFSRKVLMYVIEKYVLLIRAGSSAIDFSQWDNESVLAPNKKLKFPIHFQFFI